ncbi:MAG TPA: DUF4810 domain-containing protein [Dongiaceae bacterium]|nr:DUF4810 domain-containing protein [Dongiaceae bacterium]
MLRPLLLAALLAGLAGCVTPPMYSWGHYEDLLYASYTSPDKATPDLQITQLEADLQKARAANRPVPPGFHAHLGYLYYQVGKADLAQQEFQTEKQLFPESAVFMDRLLAKKP